MQSVSFLAPEEIEQILRLILEIVAGILTLVGPLATLLISILKRIFPQLAGTTLRAIVAALLTGVIWLPVLIAALGTILSGLWPFLTFAGLTVLTVLATETTSTLWYRYALRTGSTLFGYQRGIE